jgi:hypothetical protein
MDEKELITRKLEIKVCFVNIHKKGSPALFRVPQQKSLLLYKTTVRAFVRYHAIIGSSFVRNNS